MESSLTEKSRKNSSRRRFLSQVGGVAVASVGVGALAGGPAALSIAAQEDDQDNNSRAKRCCNIRIKAARAELALPIPNEITNGDEHNFPHRIGNFSKGLEHNTIGEVNRESYESLLRAEKRRARNV